LAPKIFILEAIITLKSAASFRLIVCQ